MINNRVEGCGMVLLFIGLVLCFLALFTLVASLVIPVIAANADLIIGVILFVALASTFLGFLILVYNDIFLGGL